MALPAPGLFDGTCGGCVGLTARCPIPMIRFLVVFFSIAAVLLSLLAAAAFSPIVQTWAVELWLNRLPGVTATVGEVAAGLSTVELTDLRINYRGSVLKVPTAELTLPVIATLREQRITVQRLAAKGWTLELRPSDAAPLSAGKSDPAGANRVTASRGLLGGWSLPGDLRLDGVDLEGDLSFFAAGAKEPRRAHGTIKGGGLGTAPQGEFAVEGIVTVPDSGRWPEAYGVDGKVAVTLATPRTIGRLAYEGRVTARGDMFPDDLRLSGSVLRAGEKPETYDLTLTRAGRRVAVVSATSAEPAGGWRGTWELELRDSDVIGLLPAVDFPALSARGRGDFEADVSFVRARMTGRWEGAIAGWGAGLAGLAPLGPVTFAADFAAARDGSAVRIERSAIELTGTRPIARLNSLQSWRYDSATGVTAAEDPKADWFEGTLHGLPIGLLSVLAEGVDFAGGNLSGAFVVGPTADGFTLRAERPWSATGVSVARAGRPLATGLDLSMALQATHSPRGWTWRVTPLRVDAKGQFLADLKLTLMPSAERSRRLGIEGTWQIDLDALARQPVLADWERLPGRTAEGTLSASIGTATELSSKLKVVGHDPTRELAANARIYIDASGQISGSAPLTITAGAQTTELTLAGAWLTGRGLPRLDLELGGVSVDLAPVRTVTRGWLAARGLAGPETLATAGPTSSRPGDPRPFWGDWRGELKLNFYQLRVAPYDITQVVGTLSGDGRSLRLQGGKGTVMPPAEPPPDPKKPRPPRGPELPRRQLTLDGAIAFEAGGAAPYRLEAAGGVDVVEFSDLLGFAKSPPEAALEGRIAVAATLRGQGGNLRELIDRHTAEFRLTARNGIARLLKANIADGITEDKPSAVGDALAGAGSLLGTVLGLGRDSIHSGARNLPKATEAVLNFTYQIPEVRYDDLAITARRTATGDVEVTEFALTAPMVRLRGTGWLRPREAQALGQSALELELAMGVRGVWADVLAPADLLAKEKDAAGYTALRDPVRLAGTPAEINSPLWREQLLKAALAPLARVKK